MADRYTIERELGRGGMATVYLARDRKHDRQVAVKVLHPEVAGALGAERFLSEIKLTANLQHPQILPLFESGQAEGFLYYVMPYIEGESLRTKLDREKELAIDDAIGIATEVAGALDYAHRQGVIHRDIKPENILLHEGQALVADFGIALAVNVAGGKRLTETGITLGTPQYVSPEQAMGDREVDARSDVYSLGCVVYEMLCGEPPHTGPTAQAIVTKALTDRPRALTQARDTVPLQLDAVVQKALAKLPSDRFVSAPDFAEALKGSDIGVTPSAPRRRGTLFAALGAAIVVSVAVGGWWIVSRGPGTVPAAVQRQITFNGTAMFPALSPDGELLAYTVTECPTGEDCRSQLMIQDLFGGNPISIGPPTPSDEVGGPRWILSIRWSPDGRSLVYTPAFNSPTLSGVYTIPRLGGTPSQRASEFFTTAASFRSSGRVIDWLTFPDGLLAGTVWRSLDLETDEITSQTLPVFAQNFDWSPEGQWLALIGRNPRESELHPLLTLMTPDGAVQDSIRTPGQSQWPRLRWDPEGDAIYVMEEDFWSVPVDPRTGKFNGQPRLLIDRLGGPELDVSRDGRRVVFGRVDGRDEIRTLRRSSGNEYTAGALSTGTARLYALAGTPGLYFPSISPDGELVAYTRGDHLGSNVYVQPFEGGQDRALTASESPKSFVKWSPSEDRIAFVSTESDGEWLNTVPVEGGRTTRIAKLSTGGFLGVYEWFPDGQGLVFRGETGGLWIAEVEETARELSPFGGAPRELSALPDALGILWGFFISPEGDSIATLSHTITSPEKSQFWVHLAALGGQEFEWRVVFSAPGDDFDINAHENSWIFPSAGFLSLQGWYPDGRLVFARSSLKGSTGYAGLWEVRTSGGPATQLLDLAPLCGGFTYVSMTPDASHIVCVHTHQESDIWLLEDFDPIR